MLQLECGCDTHTLLSCAKQADSLHALQKQAGGTGAWQARSEARRYLGTLIAAVHCNAQASICA